MGNIYVVGPNEALVVSGGFCGRGRKRFVVGGWAWASWYVTDVQRLSLAVMTLTPMCESVETAQGVALNVSGVAQCKVMNTPELLRVAAEQFLGKSAREVKATVQQTLEGHLRAILGTLTVEDVYRDREQFAALVREVAAPDVGRMGIDILSFTIRDVSDDVQYLAALGKARTAAVKRDASVGVAQAERDAGIREAECQKAAVDVKFACESRVEDCARRFKLQKAQFDAEVNAAQARAQLAFELQAAKLRQGIRGEELEIAVVERRKQIEVEALEVERRERDLEASVRLPAAAEGHRVRALAEGLRAQAVEAARAAAERVKQVGAAEAGALAGVGKAEAERMRLKAEVCKAFGDAAVAARVLQALPQIAAEVAAPLAKIDEIVILPGDGESLVVPRLFGQVPPAVLALTGVDLSQVLGKIPGARLRKGAARDSIQSAENKDTGSANQQPTYEPLNVRPHSEEILPGEN